MPGITPEGGRVIAAKGGGVGEGEKVSVSERVVETVCGATERVGGNVVVLVHRIGENVLEEVRV